MRAKRSKQALKPKKKGMKRPDLRRDDSGAECPPEL
jgi:hypothetical protein